MISLSPRTLRSWINTVVLAGLGLFIATSTQAQNLQSLVDSDAVMISLDDQTMPVTNAISQVGFFDHERGSASCGTSCGGCGKSAVCCCCEPWWSHRTGAFGQFLLLRPGNVDQIYTIEQNSTTPGQFPTGAVGRLNVDEEAGFRVGFSVCASNCTSFVASYTRWEGKTLDRIAAQPGNFLNSQIIHPSTLTVGATALEGGGGYSIDFQLIDAAYRHIWKTSDVYAINWLAGFRYGKMEQDLITQQQVSVATGLVTNDVDVDFNGFGMTFGIDGERRSCHSGLMIYGKALSSFLAGDWRGDYVQTNQFAFGGGGGIVANDYEDYRITPVLELELGFGWQSPCGHYRATVGYMTSAWYNAVSTREYVEAVRNNSYVSVDETITFNGLTTGVEARF